MNFDCKVEDYDKSRILFKYDFDKNECQYLVEVINFCIYSFTPKTDEWKSYIDNCTQSIQLQKFVNLLTEFFVIEKCVTNNSYYFPRLSTVSPKDAYLMTLLEYEINDNPTYQTLDEIKTEIGFLKCNNVEKCLLLLFNSDRILQELRYNLSNNITNSFLLLPWVELNNETETRCFVKNRKLIAVSQYFTGLQNVYPNLNWFLSELPKFIVKVLNNRNTSNRINNIVIDICLINSDYNQFYLVEMNNFDNDIDYCLLTPMDIENNGFTDKFIFKYNCDSICKTVIVDYCDEKL